ncbi:MAG: 3-hydroxyacyl-CoA dehydrogenase family protein [Myxococcales bacterium]|nr:3-hydroxyacyl-CoA dehydrogenase family protein [Myxococcales bacterium]
MRNMETVAVLGAGTMGHGIAQVCAVHGMNVRLYDIDRGAGEKGLGKIRDSLQRFVAKGKMEPGEADAALHRVAIHSELPPAARDADLVIEAAPERVEVKRKLFAEVGEAVSAECLLATNTSSLSIGALAAGVPHPARFLGLHFFNPVPLMALLEVVRGESTDDATVAAALEFAQRIGKEPIVVRDMPGFASSRLGVALGAEAIRMLESGVASAADIDKAMELGYRHPMGPLRLTDLVGLDVRLAILEYLHREVGEQFRPPDLLRRMVSEGKLGRKSGEGFYRYPET